MKTEDVEVMPATNTVLLRPWCARWGGGLVVGVALAALLGGCALHYHDAQTGAQHLWGFGHLQARARVEAGQPQAVIAGVETAGLTLGLGGGGYYLNLGFNRRATTAVAPEGANVRLEWPAGNFYQLAVSRPEAIAEKPIIPGAAPNDSP